MRSIEESIVVEVPVHRAYGQWTNFESFPSFMDGVESVKRLDPKHLRWVARIAGKRVEWDSEIFEQVPDRLLAWSSISGAKNSGSVTFEPVDTSRTRVNLHVQYEPEGFAESVGDAVGAVLHRVSNDLRRFKEYVEKPDGASDSWRGAVHAPESHNRGAVTASGYPPPVPPA